MWPFKRKPVEKSPYLYTFERLGTQHDTRKGTRTVQASGDVTIDELLAGLNTCNPSGTGWMEECQRAVLRIRAVEKPKQWMGDKS